MATQEVLFLLGIPLCYLLPIWLSFRKYGEGKSHWRLFSIVATLLLSWIGFIVISAIHAGLGGYVEGRASKPRE